MRTSCSPKQPNTQSTCVTSTASRQRSAVWRSLARAVITFCLSDRPERARPCSPSASLQFCRPCRSMRPSKRIHSVAGVLEDARGLVGTRPFRSPHHTISDAGLIGGGAVPRPGEVSLGHNGVLFLDELPEFQRNVLEVMRQPLEDGSVTIARAAVSVTFPSR